MAFLEDLERERLAVWEVKPGGSAKLAFAFGSGVLFSSSTHVGVGGGGILFDVCSRSVGVVLV